MNQKVPIGNIVVTFANSNATYVAIGMNANTYAYNTNTTYLMNVRTIGDINTSVSLTVDGRLKINTAVNDGDMLSVYSNNSLILSQRSNTLLLNANTVVAQTLYTKSYSEGSVYIIANSGSIVLDLNRATNFFVDPRNQTLNSLTIIKPYSFVDSLSQSLSCMMTIIDTANLTNSFWTSAGVVWPYGERPADPVCAKLYSFLYSPNFPNNWFGFTSSRGANTGTSGIVLDNPPIGPVAPYWISIIYITVFSTPGIGVTSSENIFLTNDANLFRGVSRLDNGGNLVYNASLDIGSQVSYNESIQGLGFGNLYLIPLRDIKEDVVPDPNGNNVGWKNALYAILPSGSIAAKTGKVSVRRLKFDEASLNSGLFTTTGSDIPMTLSSYSKVFANPNSTISVVPRGFLTSFNGGSPVNWPPSGHTNDFYTFGQIEALMTNLDLSNWFDNPTSNYDITKPYSYNIPGLAFDIFNNGVYSETKIFHGELQSYNTGNLFGDPSVPIFSKFADIMFSENDGYFKCEGIMDNSGNVYILVRNLNIRTGYGGPGSFVGTGPYNMLFKFDSNLGFLWCKYTLANNSDGFGIGFSGNIKFYVGKDNNIYVISREIIMKLNSDGTIAWSIKILPGYYNDLGLNGLTINSLYYYNSGICADSNGNIYLLLPATEGSFNEVAILVKLNSNRELVWQKVIRDTNDSFFGEYPNYITGGSIIIDSDNDLYIKLTRDSYASMVIKYPNDGSINGTFVCGTYSEFTIEIEDLGIFETDYITEVSGLDFTDSYNNLQEFVWPGNSDFANHTGIGTVYDNTYDDRNIVREIP